MEISRRKLLESVAVGLSTVVGRNAGAAPPTERPWTPNWISGQPEHHPSIDAPVTLQPLADQARQLGVVFDYLGQPFASSDREQLDAALAGADENTAILALQRVLDRYTLLTVTINPESRVTVARGAAVAELVQDGTRLFLVKVLNQAGITAALHVQSPNSRPVYVSAWKDESPQPQERITAEEIRDRWADLSLYQQQPLTERLSGLPLEYAVLEVYSRDAGQRLARIGFDVGQGTEDIGFRNEAQVLFHAVPSHSMGLRVTDDGGGATTASFIFRDAWNRLYPNKSKRLAPDLFFQPQVYRVNGETIRLPDGSYEVTCTGGPEYIAESRQIEVRGANTQPLSFQLKRWINPAHYGWYSGDHHIHAAGCSHYVTPTEGVDPDVMMRQVAGEHLNVGCTLNWAPCYYHQKQFFTGSDHPLSKPDTILHYDLEVSGFPSSHCGHLVLLGLKEQNYPGTQHITEWPTWNLPILRWAKAQGAVVGYAHSGWGLEVKSTELPNYEMPAFDGIGANEYIVDVTHPNAVDFLSAGDTPHIWELNIWYHTLNAGFRPRLSGETDFPCITDARVGQGRVYAKLDGRLTYQSWLAALQKGNSYMSDGKSHLMNFAVNGASLGVGINQVSLEKPGNVQITVQAAAYLNEIPQKARDLPYYKEPYWDIERSRIGNTRTVPVEVVFNGRCIANRNLPADGTLQNLSFSIPLEKSGWIALRVLPSSHTNPIFVTVGGRPMQPLSRSVEWCLAAVDQCWSQKAAQISPKELSAARNAYNYARQAYRKLLG
jgi:hypothetical protein